MTQGDGRAVIGTPEAVPGKAVMAVRQHLLNEGATIPIDVIRDALAKAMPHLAAGVLRSTANPESLGVMVREVWIAWAKEQPDPKPSWLTEWEDLDTGQREVDSRIGVILAGIGAAAEREHCAKLLEADAEVGEHAFPGSSATLRAAAAFLRRGGELT